jgi:hypothetical protein
MAPVYVLKFREGFDFAPVVKHFNERGFSESEYQGAKIYSHDVELGEEWGRTALQLSLYNTAVLHDKGLMVLSNKSDATRAVLDVIGGPADSLAEDKAVGEMVGRLGEIGSVIIMPGVKACEAVAVDLRAILTGREGPETRAAIEKLLETTSKLHRYDGLAVGYRFEGSDALSIVAMQYGTAEDANADLEVRRSLLDEGTSLVFAGNVPYSQLISERGGESEVKADGSTLLITVKGQPQKDEVTGREVNRMPRLLFDMMNRRDMSFAACP